MPRTAPSSWPWSRTARSRSSAPPARRLDRARARQQRLRDPHLRAAPGQDPGPPGRVDATLLSGRSAAAHPAVGDDRHRAPAASSSPRPLRVVYRVEQHRHVRGGQHRAAAACRSAGGPDAASRSPAPACVSPSRPAARTASSPRGIASARFAAPHAAPCARSSTAAAGARRSGQSRRNKSADRPRRSSTLVTARRLDLDIGVEPQLQQERPPLPPGSVPARRRTRARTRRRHRAAGSRRRYGGRRGRGRRSSAAGSRRGSAAARRRRLSITSNSTQSAPSCLRLAQAGQRVFGRPGRRAAMADHRRQPRQRARLARPPGAPAVLAHRRPPPLQ